MNRTPLKRYKPLKRGGRIRPRRNSKRNRALAEFMRLFRGRPCRVCGSRSGTVGHHVLSRGAHPELALEPMNIMILCFDHHRWFHEEPLICGVWTAMHLTDAEMKWLTEHRKEQR